MPRSHGFRRCWAVTGALLVWPVGRARRRRRVGAERTVGRGSDPRVLRQPQRHPGRGTPRRQTPFQSLDQSRRGFPKAVTATDQREGSASSTSRLGSSATRTRLRSARPPSSQTTHARSTPRSATSNRASKSPRTARATRKPATGWCSKPRSTTWCLRRNRPACSASRRSSSPTRPTRSSAPGPTATTGSTPTSPASRRSSPCASSTSTCGAFRPSPIHDWTGSTCGGWLPCGTSRTRRTAPKGRSCPTRPLLGPARNQLLQRRLRRHPRTKRRHLARDDRLRPARVRPLALGVALDQGSGHGVGRRHRPQRAAAGEPRRSLRLGDQSAQGHLPGRVLDQPERRRRQGLLLRRGGEVRHDRRSANARSSPRSEPSRCSARRCRRPLPGSIYLGEPQPGNRYRLFITANGFGTHIKLAGSVRPDPQTGRLVVAFENLPQSPLTEFDMHFFGSERGLLATPTRCGTYPVETNFTPWDDLAARPAVDPVLRDHLRPGRNAVSGPPAPLRAGHEDGRGRSTAPACTARSRSLVTRPDGDQNLAGVAIKLPPGFSATLKGIPYCSDAALARAASASYSGLAEIASPSCPAASQVGTATAGAGAGNHPLYSPGKVYLAGPYKGAPLSLAVVTPRSPARTTSATSSSASRSTSTRNGAGDRRLRSASAASSTGYRCGCARSRSTSIARTSPSTRRVANRSQVEGTIAGAEGGLATPTNHFQVGNCRTLDYEPKLSLSLSGGLARRGHPAIHAILDAGPGEANTRRVSVALPRGELLDNGHIDTVCTRVQFAADACPAGSVLGTARGEDAAARRPAEGQVYLRSGPNKLPDLVVDLQGQIDIVLVGKIDTASGDPCAPRSRRSPTRRSKNSASTLPGARRACSRTASRSAGASFARR